MLHTYVANLATGNVKPRCRRHEQRGPPAGRVVNRPDRRTNGRTDGHANGRIERHAEGRRDGTGNGRWAERRCKNTVQEIDINVRNSYWPPGPTATAMFGPIRRPVRLLGVRSPFPFASDGPFGLCPLAVEFHKVFEHMAAGTYTINN